MGEPTALVIGADGLIGSSLASALRRDGLSVLETTRRKQFTSKERLYVDLSRPAEHVILPTGISVAFLCAGITSIAECEKNSLGTSRINVDNSLQLLDKIQDKGGRVVAISTNLVFDGQQPRVASQAPYSPVSEYGRQKAQLESKLREDVHIIRLGKVVNKGSDLFKRWIKEWKSGRKVQAFYDMKFAPVCIELAVETLIKVFKDPSAARILQLTACRDISYLDAARHIAVRLGIPTSRIEGISARQLLGPDSFFPKNTTLDAKEWSKFMGQPAPDPLDSIDIALDLI